MIKLSIITVTYYSAKFIEKYLDSVLKNTSFDTEIIIVDSGSKDGTVEVIKSYLKSKGADRVRLIESKENIGFGRGNNMAAKQARGEYFFFLNPDTELRSSLEEMLRFYESSEEIGIVAPKLIKTNGEIQPSVKKLPSVWGAFKEYVLGIKYSYSEYSPKSDEPTEVETVYGAAMLVSRKIFEELGGFNEKFFMYYEDVDFCRRVRKLRKSIFYYPGVEVMHMVGASKADEDRYFLNMQSAKKYHGIIGAFFLQLIFLIPRLRRRLSVS